MQRSHTRRPLLPCISDLAATPTALPPPPRKPHRLTGEIFRAAAASAPEARSRRDAKDAMEAAFIAVMERRMAAEAEEFAAAGPPSAG
jgi:hypothetical protein